LANAVGICRHDLGGVSMSSQPWDVSDELWVRLEPLIPKKPRRFRYPGRRPLDDRRVLSGSCSCS
jgi:transposase